MNSYSLNTQNLNIWKFKFAHAYWLNYSIWPYILYIFFPFFSGNTINPLSTNPTRWSNTLKQFVGELPTNCLLVLEHFPGLTLTELIISSYVTCKLLKYEKVICKTKAISKTNVLFTVLICKYLFANVTL